MAELTINEATGAREFRVPFEALSGDFLLRSGGELIVRSEAPGERPVAVELAFHPPAFEFQAKLPALLSGSSFPAHPGQLSMAASGRQAVVVFEGGAQALARIPAGLASLDQLADWLTHRPPAFVPSEFTLAAIAFEDLPAPA